MKQTITNVTIVSVEKQVINSTAFLLMCVVLGLSGCGKKDGANNESKVSSVMDDEAGVLMMFKQVDQQGQPAFNSRMFVNNKFLFIDDENFPDDYLLYNRKERTIYSVTHDTNTIFVIRPKEIKGESPIPIKYRAETEPSDKIPDIDGLNATHYRYYANDKQCYDVVTLDKSFMPEVVQAIREYRSVLAGEHASTVHEMPTESYDPCELATNIYYATKHLETGFPVRQWDQTGRLKQLVNYKTKVKFDPAKLTIPKDFKEFSIDQ